jgi:hypothetical protein
VKDGHDVFIAVMLAVFVFLIGFAVGTQVGQSNAKEEAVRASSAYYTNDASGKSLFKWKECK